MNKYFFSNELDLEQTKKKIHKSLCDFDDGELFLEKHIKEFLSFEDKTLKNASFNVEQGFGLRSVSGEFTGYSYSSDLSDSALQKAIRVINSSKSNNAKQIPANINTKNLNLYSNANPINEHEFNQKINLLEKIDSYVRAKEPKISQVSISIANSLQDIAIIKKDNFFTTDTRPLVRLNISVIANKNDRSESGSYGYGGRSSAIEILKEESWKNAADEAIRQALVNLDSKPAPAGEMEVVLGNGWPGVLLHEAVGHGLEGDFNRKKTSAFSELIGKQVAAKGVTVIDDGTIANRRGSLNIDDEGTPTNKNILIEDGILKGYMQDRLNARLMGAEPTGNGRRESYCFAPMPRMTNTFMLPGNHGKDEIISSVKKGIYAANFGGGQVDITSGKFVFSTSECYLIENGKITTPLKGATLIGNGPDALTKIKMIGNDLELDPGIGTCGKAGQGVPVGVGQPTLLMEGLTVGGTNA